MERKRSSVFGWFNKKKKEEPDAVALLSLAELKEIKNLQGNIVNILEDVKKLLEEKEAIPDLTLLPYEVQLKMVYIAFKTSITLQQLFSIPLDNVDIIFKIVKDMVKIEDEGFSQMALVKAMNALLASKKKR